MGNTPSDQMGAASLLKCLFEIKSPRQRTREEERENLLKPRKMLRTGSVPKSIQRHLGQAKEEKPESLPKRAKSMDYLREPHKSERWLEGGVVGIGDNDSDCDTDSLIENPSMTSEPSPVKGLCDTCRAINIESVTTGAGFMHKLLSDIYETEESCKVCGSIRAGLNIKWDNPYEGDRYRIAVCLEPESESTSPNRSGHFDASSIPASDHQPTSHLQFHLMDCRPWEELYIKPYLYSWADKPNEYSAPIGSKPEIVISHQIAVLTNEHDPAAEAGVTWVREIGQNTVSERSFGIAANWLEACLSCEPPARKTTWEPDADSHVEGRPPVDAEHAWTLQEATKADSLLAETPSRLIEVRPNLGSEDLVRLVETEAIGRQEPIRFAALSYCWGKPKPGDSGAGLTKKASLASHLSGLSRSALPATIQDAIMVAEKLHIPYIWIDALCIVQDDEDDWAREAAKMSGIYLCAVLTIAVASSSSADDGCFNTESEPTVRSDGFRKDWATLETTLQDGRHSCLYLSPYRDVHTEVNMYEDQVLEGPLARRAWTLQEQILPRRTLYYTSKQLMWKCEHCLVDEENLPQPQHQELYPILDFDCALVPEAMDDLWYQGVVEQYSKRQLTYGKDKLVAISALAKATHLNRRIDYVAGLWKDCILFGLLWRRDSPGTKNKTYPCPSWSWASQDSAVSYDRGRHRTYNPSVFTPRVVHVRWETAPASPFGDVLSASVHLDTKLRLACVLRDHSVAFSSKQADSNLEGKSQSLTFFDVDANSTTLWHAEAIMDDEGIVGGPVVIATMLGRQSGAPVFLVLEPPDLGADAYRRVGIAQLERSEGCPFNRLADDEDLTCDWERRTIKLV